jgi:hypothetical protein
MENKGKKQQYEKPLVKRFPLRPEEAVLGFCKTTNGGGPGARPGSACEGVFCKTAGS